MTAASLGFDFFIRATLYSRIPLVHGEPYGVADIIKLFLGWALLFALALSIIALSMLVICGLRTNLTCGCAAGENMRGSSPDRTNFARARGALEHPAKCRLTPPSSGHRKAAPRPLRRRSWRPLGTRMDMIEASLDALLTKMVAGTVVEIVVAVAYQLYCQVSGSQYHRAER